MESIEELVSTAEFAAANMVKPGSVISRLSRHGSYFGVRPRKLANGRLVWPDPRVVTHVTQASGQEAADAHA